MVGGGSEGQDRPVQPERHARFGLNGWPDWTGEIVAIVASGPSVKTSNIDALRGKARIIAIKENVDICPWADMVYGCDGPWWKHRKGLPEFTGMKVCWGGNGLEGHSSIRRVAIAVKGGNRYLDDLQMNPGTVGAGGNSGFQALNLAVQFGARRILLVGFDMTDRNGIHWYGRNTWNGANNPNEMNFRRWLEAFEKAAPVLAGLGVEVVNTSQVSAMRCFPRRSIEDMLAEWQ